MQIRLKCRCYARQKPPDKDKYSIKFLCEIISVNRSGYYKWLASKYTPNRYEKDRIILTELLLEQHKKHKTKGYHYLARLVRNETGWLFSDNLAHKCCKLAGIRSKTNRGRKYAGKEHIKFPNTIKGNWETTKPLEIVVSDMTCIYHKGVRWEWTYILDTYNNEIIASSVTNKRGSSLPYYHCLNKLIEKTKEQSYPVTLHTDQGSVYSSSGFYQTHKHYTNIKRSMSGTPTDNPIIDKTLFFKLCNMFCHRICAFNFKGFSDSFVAWVALIIFSVFYVHEITINC